MTQLTLRGFDPELERRLRALAAERQLSLNRAALLLMRRGAGLEERPGTGSEGRAARIGSALDSFIGVWSEAEETEFRQATAPLDQIDPELWR